MSGRKAPRKTAKAAKSDDAQGMPPPPKPAPVIADPLGGPPPPPSPPPGSPVPSFERILVTYLYLRNTMHSYLAENPHVNELDLISDPLSAALTNLFEDDTVDFTPQEVRNELKYLKEIQAIPDHVKHPTLYEDEDLADILKLVMDGALTRDAPTMDTPTIRMKIIKEYIAKGWHESSFQSIQFTPTGEFASENPKPITGFELARSELWIEKWVRYFSFAHWSKGARQRCIDLFLEHEKNHTRAWSNSEIQKKMYKEHYPRMSTGAVAHFILYSHWACLDTWPWGVKNTKNFMKYFTSKGDGFEPVIKFDETGLRVTVPQYPWDSLPPGSTV